MPKLLRRNRLCRGKTNKWRQELNYDQILDFFILVASPSTRFVVYPVIAPIRLNTDAGVELFIRFDCFFLVEENLSDENLPLVELNLMHKFKRVADRT
jgi:hypothetical protein